MRRALLGGLGLLLAASAAASSAPAQDVDPNREGSGDPESPLGVEYQLPLQRTRRESAGLPALDPGREEEGERAPAGGARPLPLFGVGLGARLARGGGPAGSGDADEQESTPRGSAPPSSGSAVAGEGSDPPLPWLAITAGALAAGALLGLALRRIGSP